MTQIIHTPEALAQQANQWHEKKQRIGLVPTMGALHAGHLSLINLAKNNADKVIVSIFVNPMQFGPNEDYDRYPRHETRDITKLIAMGVDGIYLPKAQMMYPEGFATKIQVTKFGERLCGPKRPGHFDGVATVVAKLLLQSRCDIAAFGEKDFQQLQIIRRMVADLDIPVIILSGPTLREADGLAMSSRNQYLTESERKIAPALYAVLQRLVAHIKSGEDVEQVLKAGIDNLIRAGFNAVDYLELSDANTLQQQMIWKTPARLIAAVYLGKTRLIDNIPVE